MGAESGLAGHQAAATRARNRQVTDRYCGPARSAGRTTASALARALEAGSADGWERGWLAGEHGLRPPETRRARQDWTGRVPEFSPPHGRGWLCSARPRALHAPARVSVCTVWSLHSLPRSQSGLRPCDLISCALRIRSIGAGRFCVRTTVRDGASTGLVGGSCPTHSCARSGSIVANCNILSHPSIPCGAGASAERVISSASQHSE